MTQGTLPSPRPGRRGTGRLIASLLFATFMAPAVIDAQSPGPAGRNPSPVHTPSLAPGDDDEPPGYHQRLETIVDRYVELHYSARLQEALAEAQTGLRLAEENRRPEDEAQFLKATGYVSWLLGDTAAATDYAQRLLALADRFDDNALRSIASRVLGSIARQLGDLDKSLTLNRQARDYAAQAGNDGLRFGAINNLGVLAMETGDFAEARRLHEEVLAYRESQGNRWDAAGSLTNLADVALAERDLPHALALHERAYAIRREVGDTRGQMRSLRQVAGTLRQLGRADEALERLQAALARTEEITGHELLADLWREIALTQEARGALGEALAAERRATTEREALAGERTRARIAELETRFDLARKEQLIASLDAETKLQETEIRLREAELSRIRYQRVGLVSAAVTIVLALAFVAGRQRTRLAAERKARAAAEQPGFEAIGLLGIASHDLRNPLGNIVLLSEELQRESVGSSVNGEFAQLIGAEAERLLKLVQDLIDTAALEVGRLELHRRPVNLAHTLASVIAEFTRSAEDKQQRLQLHVSADASAELLADEPRLRQVAANLISNAIKFSPPARTIQVNLARTADMLELRVTDEGPGITAADRERLFQPFTRLSAVPTGDETSHGLGLSIVHEIVRLHGGRVRVESTPGQGSTFIVELPAAPAA